MPISSPPTADRPAGTIVGHSLVAAGLAAVLLGTAWGRLVPDEVFWSTEDAVAYQRLQAAAHSASIGPAHNHAGHSHGAEGPQHGGQADVAQAMAEFAAAEARLRRAQGRRHGGGRLVMAAGACAALVGVLLLRRPPAPAGSPPR